MKKVLLLALTAVFVFACSPASKDNPIIPSDKLGSQTQEEPDVVPTVTTGNISAITANSAKVSGSYAGATNGVYNRGIWYGTSAESLPNQLEKNVDKAKSGSFEFQLNNLEPSTTYYFKAFVTIYNASKNTYTNYFGEVKHFTTGNGTPAVETLPQYLGCYEMPEIDLESKSDCSDTGKEQYVSHSSGTVYGDANWYSYLTNNEKQRVVSHTFIHNNAQKRNLTILVDKDRQGPLWVAFPMNSDYYPRRSDTGRSNNWTEDPGVPSDWQRSEAVGTGSSVKYARGHFCASDYRQVDDWSNQGTFYYTNQALQWQSSFNSGNWSSLEGAVVSNTPSGRDTLYVVVGVLYEGDPVMVTTNNNIQAQVPSHFYKCLMKCSFDEDGSMTAAKGCAYIFENKANSGGYAQGITSIDAIEQRAGFNFFANVPKELQDAAEAQNAALW